MRYFVFIITLTVVSISYSQNNQKIFEQITQKIILKKEIHNTLGKDVDNKKFFYVKIIDNLYTADEYRNLRLINNEEIYIMHEYQLFFYQVDKWLEFDPIDFSSKKIKIKVKILQKKNGIISPLIELKTTYQKSKILNEIEE